MLKVLGGGGCGRSRVNSVTEDDDDDANSDDDDDNSKDDDDNSKDDDDNSKDDGDDDNSKDDDDNSKDDGDSSDDSDYRDDHKEAERLFGGSGSDSEDTNEDAANVGVKWKSKNKFPSLNDSERARLPTQLALVLKSGSFQSIGTKPGLYKFVHNVTKRFRSIMQQ